jgi:ParB family chromosome partitioning protein
MSKFKDRAASIRFDEDGEAAAPAPAAQPEPVAAPRSPRTGMGLIAASITMGRDLETENNSLKEKLASFDGASVARRLDPKLIRPSAWANRNEASFATESFQALKQDIADHGGNEQAIKVRPLTGGRDRQGAEYEIVFGHRRHRACLELGIEVLAIVEDTSDVELFVGMERENRHRDDLSAWEQGVMYKRALDSKLFPSMRQLASSISRDVADVSRAIVLADLPSEIIGAFGSPLELQFRWATPLRQAMDRSADAVMATARRLSKESPRRPGKAVFEALVGEPVVATARAVPVQLSSGGRLLATIASGKRGALDVRIEPGVVPEAVRDRFLDALRQLLSEG